MTDQISKRPLPRIYGFVNQQYRRDVVGFAISEDGRILASHMSSNEVFLKHDLGMDGECDWKHEHYREAYPDGYEVEYVPMDQRDNHAGLQAALALYTPDDT